MDTLSSCYFCSTALDASLDEYPVVPDRLRTGDPDQTVVLCDTCARKLDAVFESVVAAVEAGAASDAPAPTDDANTPESSDADDADADSLESTLGDDEDVLRSVGGGDANEADDDDADSGNGGADENSGGKERTYTRSRGAGWQRDEKSDPRPGSLRDSSDADERERKYGDSRGAGWRREDDRRNGTSESASGGSADETATSGSSADETATSGDDSDQSGADNGSDEETDSDGGKGSDGGEDTPDVSMTRLENTKVMRLLENREFPVDKEEFVTVAASAYQISRDDCEKVLDLAIQHDLIHEEDGRIVGGEL